MFIPPTSPQNHIQSRKKYIFVPLTFPLNIFPLTRNMTLLILGVDRKLFRREIVLIFSILYRKFDPDKSSLDLPFIPEEGTKKQRNRKHKRFTFEKLLNQDIF